MLKLFCSLNKEVLLKRVKVEHVRIFAVDEVSWAVEETNNVTKNTNKIDLKHKYVSP
jgi:hypothetical protein